MKALGFGLSLLTVSLVACGGAGTSEEAPLVIDWLLEQKSFSPLMGLPGIPTACGALGDDACTDVSHYEFERAPDGSLVWIEYEYVYKIDPSVTDDTTPAWFADNGLAGGLIFTGTVRAIPGVPEREAIFFDATISGALGPDAWFSSLVGEPMQQILARAEADDVLLSWSKPADDYAFPAAWTVAGPEGSFPMKVCKDRVAGSGEPGFCAPVCRGLGAANGLEACTEEHEQDVPRSARLIASE